MMVSPLSKSGSRSPMSRSTAATGTMSQIARGLASRLTSSVRVRVGVAPSCSKASSTASLRAYTTVSCPPLMRRRTMSPPMRPKPIMPSCIVHLVLVFGRTVGLLGLVGLLWSDQSDRPTPSLFFSADELQGPPAHVVHREAVGLQHYWPRGGSAVLLHSQNVP